METKQYTVTESGTAYHIETSQQMIELLERIREEGTRVRFHWGDVKTGKDWGDIYDVSGTIGRSIGNYKIPLLIHNSRSYGGGAILTHCIVKITTTRNPKITLYEHPNYHI